MFLGLDSFLKLALFWSYILLWDCQSILVHLANTMGIQYNFTSVVVFQDFLKIIISIGMIWHEERPLETLRNNWKLAFYYILPACLYAIYNTLTFVALSKFDPSTYFVLLQVKIVVTALLSVIILKTEITRFQWMAISVITIGSMLKEGYKFLALDLDHTAGDYAIVFLQIFLSTFAGIYTEKLLTLIDGPTPSFHNLFLYIDSVIINILFLTYQGTIREAFSIGNIATLFSPVIITVVISASTVGIVTGYFIRYLGNIMKAIAGAIELWTVSIFSSIIFGYEIHLIDGIAISLVAVGVWLYSYGSSTVSKYQPVSKDSSEITDC